MDPIKDKVSLHDDWFGVFISGKPKCFHTDCPGVYC